MKKILIILVIAILASCGNKKENFSVEEVISEEATLEKGEQLFQENNCAACHQPNQKVIGPSLLEIATIYKQKNADMVSFLKEESEPIVDPSMYESMKINLQVTKNKSDIELQSLELYVLSHSK